MTNTNRVTNTTGQKMIFSTFQVKIKLHFIFKSKKHRFENKMKLNFNLESRENHFLTSAISHPVGICHLVLRYLQLRAETIRQTLDLIKSIDFRLKQYECLQSYVSRLQSQLKCKRHCPCCPFRLKTTRK